MTSSPHSDRDDVGLYVLGALDADARAAFETHFATCDECQAEVRSVMPVVAGLAIAVPQVEPSPALRERVLAVTRTVPAEKAAPRSTVVTAARTAAPSLAWLATAAALVATVGLGIYAMMLRERVDALTARLAEAERDLAATRSDVVQARQAVSEAESSVRVLLAPDLTRVDLAGQTGDPSTRGRAFYSPSIGLVFTATRLPPLAAGRVYQLWVVTPEAPVSAALLTPDASGATAATVPPPTTAPAVAFAVTIEPAGGVPAPTGDKVLVGLVGNP